MYSLQTCKSKQAKPRKKAMTQISITDRVKFRQAVLEHALALAASAIPSVVGGNSSPLTFPVVVNGIEVEARIGYIHPIPFADDLTGATVLIGVFFRRDYESKVSLLPEELLPEGYNLDEPVTFTVQIFDNPEDGRGYSYKVLDPELRLAY